MTQCLMFHIPTLSWSTCLSLPYGSWKPFLVSYRGYSGIALFSGAISNGIFTKVSYTMDTQAISKQWTATANLYPDKYYRLC